MTIKKLVETIENVIAIEMPDSKTAKRVEAKKAVEFMTYFTRIVQDSEPTCEILVKEQKKTVESPSMGGYIITKKLVFAKEGLVEYMKMERTKPDGTFTKPESPETIGKESRKIISYNQYSNIVEKYGLNVNDLIEHTKYKSR
jgi:hypothetical protein